MANRYWVGGTNSNWISFGNWAATSGGAATASVPTSADDVFFDANSGSGTVKVSATGSNNIAYANNLDCTGYAGTIDLGGSGSGNTLRIYGNLISGTATTWTDSTNNNNSCRFYGSSKTVTSNGRTINAIVRVETGSSITLVDAFVCQQLLVYGTFNTASNSVSLTGYAGNYTQALLQLGSAGSITCGSSTITLDNLLIPATATISAGTSTFAFRANPVLTPSIDISGKTLYNITAVVQNDGYASRGFEVQTSVNCNNITFSGAAASPTGNVLSLYANITATGTVTLNGNSIKTRMFVRSANIGTIVTITANACTASYVDFASVTFAGAAAPISGTSLGDAKRNTGITFTSPKTVYFSSASSLQEWKGSNVWATSSGGAGADANYPLAQDTVIYDNNSGPAGAQLSIDAFIAYASIQVGELSFSTRTTSVSIVNALSIYSVSNLTFSSSVTGGVYPTFGNSSPITFTPQTVSAGGLNIDCQGSSVSLGGNLSVGGVLQFTSGTLNIGSQTLTITSGGYIDGFSFVASSINTGTGVIDLQGTGTLINASLYWSVTGSGTIKFSSSTGATKILQADIGTSITATIDQAGSGPLRIQNGGTFGNLTNSYSSTGATTVTLTGGQIYTFTSFNLTGSLGKVCTFTSSGGRANIRKSTGAWYMGANSTNAGNNSGLAFTAGGTSDYLTVSNINGTASQNTFLLY